MTTMMRGWVTLDGSAIFAATWDAADTWNGFLAPRFTRDEADRVVRWVNAQAEAGEDTTGWWDGDVLVVREGENSSAERYGPGMYAIGAGGWAWSEASGGQVCRVCGAPVAYGEDSWAHVTEGDAGHGAEHVEGAPVATANVVTGTAVDRADAQDVDSVTEVGRHWHALAHLPGERFVAWEESAVFPTADEAWRHVAADLDAGLDQARRFARTPAERDAVDARYMDAHTDAHHGSETRGAVTVEGDEHGSPALVWRVWPCTADHGADITAP